MRKHIFSVCLCVISAVSCSIHEVDQQAPYTYEDQVFYARMEEHSSDNQTKVYVDDDLMVLWHADDRVSIFNKYTYNQEYRFTGQTGDNSGSFKSVDNGDYVTGNSLDNIYAIYPYQKSTKISNTGVITVTLPAEQKYAENTFGLGANTMVSATTDNQLLFKNVGGYLMLKLYGDDVTVSSITLKGNNGERISGNASVTIPVNGVPAIAMSETAGQEITLVCKTPVKIGSTAETATTFWIVVPPTTFSKGFTLTVKDNKSAVFEKVTSKSFGISRNKLARMSALFVETKDLQPNNELWYTSTDGRVINPYDQNVFGATIVSNQYVDGKGIISFDGDVSYIGEKAFYYCGSLTSIIIPESVTSIGDYAFYESGLRSLTIPKSVTSIGIGSFSYCSDLMTAIIPDGVVELKESAFSVCSRLASIQLPNSLKLIGDFAFSGCVSLKSVEIPSSVTNIGNRVFSQCTSLLSFSGKYATSDGLLLINEGVVLASALAAINGSITIPDGITRIGEGAFSPCKGLKNIVLPQSVMIIDKFAFDNCSGLSSIILPDNLEHIERMVFFGCTSLTGITIPKNVTRIDYGAFGQCTRLMSITIPERIECLGEAAFANCSGLNSITVLASTPPSGGNRMFDATNACPILVPFQSVDAYKSAQYWSDYADRIKAVSTSPVPDAIDLGLPSGLKWASFNIGASAPEEYGDYYAWGETEPYYISQSPLAWKEGKSSGYDWASYQWSNGSNISITKYNTDSSRGTVDNKVALDASDDVAHVMLGDRWRMPTIREWSELLDYCTSKWTTLDGVKGMMITGKNGNSIFLPATGQWRGLYFYDLGSYGNYWITSLDTDAPSYAEYLYFDAAYFRFKNTRRSYGLSIRPVSGDRIDPESVTLNKTSLLLATGTSHQLSATISPANATYKEVTWSSSNTSVATVSSEGLVTAYAAGTATITATTVDSRKKATCAVTVQAQTVSVTGVSLDKTSLSMTVGDTQTLTVTITPSNATDKSVTWSSSNTSVATVSSSGVVTAKSAGSAVITVTANDGGIKATCSVTVKAQNVSVTGVSLDKTSLTMTVGDSQTLTFMVTPSNATDKSVTWSSCNTSVAAVSSSGVVTAKAVGSATITVTTNDGGKKATCTLTVNSSPYSIPVPEAIDLGLSVKWASYNLGASQQEEFGYYYAWGETIPKDDYSWATYKWCQGSASTLIKYCKHSSYGNNGFTDNRNVLELEDDAANVNLGGKWRMPTDAEWTELLENCTWTWTRENGVNGYKVTSNNNGKSIFLPHAGTYEGSILFTGLSKSSYWSSSLHDSDPTAWVLYFDHNSGLLRRWDDNRSYGHPVRPVLK